MTVKGVIAAAENANEHRAGQSRFLPVSNEPLYEGTIPGRVVARGASLASVQLFSTPEVA